MHFIENAQARCFFGQKIDAERRVEQLEMEMKKLQEENSQLRRTLLHYKLLPRRVRKLLRYVKKRSTLHQDVPELGELVWWIKDTLRDIASK
jgi:hypothetical protein